MCDISIVMSFYNRTEQTLLTLDGFQKMYYGKYNFEVIIVDDGSNKENDLEQIIHNYSFPIKLIEIRNEDKTWINPVIPYNLGFQYCRGDNIILQNPEIFHTSDICKYIMDNLQDDLYVTFPVFAMADFEHNKRLREIFENNVETDLEYVKFISGINYDYVPWKGWYNHKAFNCRNFHFLSILKRNLLEKIGGFCNLFKDGLWFDDDDFLQRIKKVARVITEDIPHLGIHQFHLQGSTSHSSEESRNLIEKNKTIYEGNMRDNVVYCNPDVSDLVKSYTILTNF